MRLSMDVNPEPTDRMKSDWAFLDAVAKKVFNKPYDALKSVQKSDLHFNLNLGMYKEI